ARSFANGYRNAGGVARRAEKRRGGKYPGRLRNLPHLRRSSLPTEVPSAVSAGLTYLRVQPWEFGSIAETLGTTDRTTWSGEAMTNSSMFDVVTVGGGMGASALAIAMARSGARVLVLEKETKFRDRVRGEALAPWGVAEARKLGVADLLLNTCA